MDERHLYKVDPMKMSNQELIADLVERTEANMKIAEMLKTKSDDQLNQKKTDQSWSALECIEHLNRYGDFYLPEIKAQFISAAKVPESTIFKSGVIGNYFAKSLQPQGKKNKMKTFTTMNPLGSKLVVSTIDTFIQQQLEIIELLERSRLVDLRRTKTKISISKVIKLRLGDTFRVVIYHNQRHLQQAERALV